MDILNEKHKQLIKLLIDDNPNWISNLQIRSMLNVSQRTVSNYINTINDAFPSLISSSVQGYKLEDIPRASEIIESTSLQYSQEERIMFLLKTLALNESVNYSTYFDYCYFSESSFESDIKKVKNYLRQISSQLVRKKDAYYIVNPTERVTRKIINHILSQESKYYPLLLSNMNHTVQSQLSNDLKRLITETTDKYHYFVNDYVMDNLIVHILVMLNRVQSNQYLDNRILEDNFIDTADITIARDLAQSFESRFDVSITESEVYELAIMLRSRYTTSKFEYFTLDKTRSLLGEHYSVIIDQILIEVKNTYYINLTENQEFYIRFAIHIHNLIFRSKSNALTSNSLHHSIKQNYPYIYEVSSYISHRLNTLINIRVNDDEISLIALHIGAVIMYSADEKEKIHTVIYAPKYYDYATKFAELILDRFNNDIAIHNIYTELPDNTIINTDLIITTEEYNTTLVPSVRVGQLLNNLDFDKIQCMISTIKDRKKLHHIQNLLSVYTSDSLFEILDEPVTKDDVLKHISKLFYTNGFTDEEYFIDLKNRELLSSTNYSPRVAMPHAIKMNAHKTGIVVLLLNKPCLWSDTEKVDIVIGLAVQASDYDVFSEMLEFFISKLSDLELAKRIVKSKSYDDFINIINS